MTTELEAKLLRLERNVIKGTDSEARWLKEVISRAQVTYESIGEERYMTVQRAQRSNGVLFTFDLMTSDEVTVPYSSITKMEINKEIVRGRLG